MPCSNTMDAAGETSNTSGGLEAGVDRSGSFPIRLVLGCGFRWRGAPSASIPKMPGACLRPIICQICFRQCVSPPAAILLPGSDSI